MILRTLPIVSLALSALAAVPSHSPTAEPAVLEPSASKELLYLHRKLIETESITENEEDVGDWLTKYLREHDWTVERQEVSKDRYNLLAYGSKRETTILLSSHIDTVPPYWPYYYNETTDIIGGRGSVDAKGSVAPMIIAAEAIKGRLQDDISLLFVVGEETGGDGMRAFSDWTKRPSSHEIVIFGEPTEAKLVCGHKGMLGFSVKATGKAAHSGYPWLGVSANDIMVEALGELLKLRDHLPWSTKYGNTTMNFGRVQGGVAANVVAETATANIATRLAAGTPDLVRGQILNALKDVKASAQQEGGDLDIEWASEGYGVVDMNCDIDGFETMTVNYGTDVPNLSGDHKRYLYGPGSIFVAHSDHEALKRKELEQAVLDYRRLIIKATEVRGKERHAEVEETQIEL
ncbi:acetylornithine deacetylase [Stemphylium lycopersici]|uniref:Acetylornithine deacetylase n=1 Tax=Stemphylium lycopersici TaxID=183478 RepID=A0A364MW18_STELY|nr:acetylornithine deacetylase [Stemphylium lycopersici]RAR05870.1 acetylornithine deacetylase [Stemphylium lycopersici]